MFNKIVSMVVLMVVALLLANYSRADMSDKATIGGQDSSGNYSWRVDSNNNLIPGTSSQNNIGGASNLVAGIYVVTITASGNAVVSGNITTTGNMTFGGINWDAIKVNLGRGINWTDAYITAGIAGGVNWASLRASFGNTSTSTNWQAFGV